MIKKTNVFSHSYFFLPKAYPNIWRAQLLSPESGELAHSNMYFRTSGHVMLSSSSSKKQRFSSISHQVLFTRLFIFLSLYNVQDRKHYIVSKYSFLAFFFKNSLVQVFSILPKLQLKPMTSLFNGKCKERMPLGQMTSFKVKIKFDFIGNLIAKTHSNVSFLKKLMDQVHSGTDR